MNKRKYLPNKTPDSKRLRPTDQDDSVNKKSDDVESNDMEIEDFTPEEEEEEVEEFDMLDEDDIVDTPLKFSDSASSINKPTKEVWSRRPVPDDFNSKKSNLTFMQIDADYYTTKQKKGYPGVEEGKQCPVIRMYGVTEHGNSVMCHIHGHTPYFYVELPEKFNTSLASLFGVLLNKKMQEKGIKKVDNNDFVVKVDLAKKKSLMHYQFGKEKDFLIVYASIPSYVRMLRTTLEQGFDIGGLGYRKFLTYESNILFVLRCMIDDGIVGGNWLKLPSGKYTRRSKEDSDSHCQIEVDVSYEEIISYEPVDEWQKIAPLRILSFDIECAGEKGHFPSAERDPVIQIANHVMVQGETKPIIQNVFTLGSCSHINGVDVLSFEKESDMIGTWRDLIVEVDPDILTGYNIVNFDFPYLLNRAATLKIPRFPQLGRVKKSKSKMKNSVFSSKAYGTRESKDINIEGRVQLDMLQIVRRDYKLSSYTLNNVSAHFLDEQKEEVHHSIISDLQNGTADTRRRLAVYCFKDAYLPQRLLQKLMIMPNYVEMARVTGIPLGYILQRGQQVKVISQLLRKAKTKNLIVPTPPKVKRVSEDSYTGAKVIEPKVGFYKENVTTLDFASLYPSIMIAHNLCYTTLVKKSEIKELKDVDYFKTPSGDCFIRKSVEKGLLPEILEELLKARRVAKQDLKKATDPSKIAVLNGRQLALKVSANSVYGFTGATVGQLPCLEISSSVTSIGRKMILETASYVKDKYTIKNGYKADADVIYGDSVLGDTPIILRNKETKNIEIKRIDNINNSELWKSYEEFKPFDTFASNRREKMQKSVQSFEVWTKNGWSNIKRVIKHKCKKKIYRIVTHSSVVDVTEDHSLLDVDGEIIKPSNCKVGTLLLNKNLHSPKKTSSPPIFEEIDDPIVMIKEKSIIEQLVFIYGFFIRHGTCGKYDTESGVKYSWTLYSSNIESCKVLCSVLEKIYKCEFIILDTMKNTNVYKIIPNTGNMKEFVTEYNCFYNSYRQKILPGFIQNGNQTIKKSFFMGYYYAGTEKRSNQNIKTIRFDCKNKITASMLFNLVASLGYNVSLSDRKDMDTYCISCSRSKLHKNVDSIKKIYIKQSSYENFVYDIETEDGTFNTGFPLIVKNTDSVMIKFGEESMEESMKLGREAAEYVSKHFVNPIKLEFEKVYNPYLLLAKKRYAGLLWTNTEKYDKIDAKGIETVRRDNCALVRDVISTCLYLILVEGSVDEAEKYAKSVISDLLMNRIDISMLVITKSLSKKSEDYSAKQAHVELALRMQKRDSATAPRIGDRVPYVIIKKERNAKAYEKSEDPIWVLENNIPIDSKYYLEHKLKNPLLQIFEPILKDASKLINGEHTRNISIPTPKKGGIMKFTKKTITCLGCKAPLKSQEAALCSNCKPKEAEILQKILTNRNHLETMFSRVWTHCQRCQGSLHQDVLCTNRDCPVFYMRKKVQKDLKDVQESVERFESIEW